MHLDTRQLVHFTVVSARAAIRSHRDARGDDRCWLDDYIVWSVLQDTPQESKDLPPLGFAMAKCREFYRHRRADTADPPAVEIIDQSQWNIDLKNLTIDQLEEEAERLRDAIRKHRDIKNRPRTVGDDRALYAVLPEKVPADFRLPSEDEFLGTAKPNAGCPNFWASHGKCGVVNHDLHSWGPCKRKQVVK